MKLLIVFNHDYSKIVNQVVHYYNMHFEDIRIAAPFKHPRGIYYYTGSYMWQGAIVEYLKCNPKLNESLLIIHDDVSLNPARIDFLKEINSTMMGHTYKVEGDFWQRHWNFRLSTNWFQSKSVLLGSGNDSPLKTLKKSLIYERNSNTIEGLSKSSLSLSDSLQSYPEIIRGYINQYHNGQKFLNFDIPLFCGNSDILIIHPEDSIYIQDFLEKSIEIGMFVEHAIPTMIRWLGKEKTVFGDNLDFPFGAEYNKFDYINSRLALQKYFERYPNTVAIHPVKYSKFTQED